MRRKAVSTSEQFPLPGFDPPSKATEQLFLEVQPDMRPVDHLFFAAQPDTHAAAHIAYLAQHWRSEHGLYGKLLDAARLHVSLFGLGECYELTSATVERAHKAASTIALPPFLARFDGVLSFSGRSDNPNSNPFVLKGSDSSIELTLLQRTLAGAMRNVGVRNKASSFTPHITLLYDRKMIAERAIESVEFTVREFVLVQSHVGQIRPYTILDRWKMKE